MSINEKKETPANFDDLVDFDEAGLEMPALTPQ